MRSTTKTTQPRYAATLKKRYQAQPCVRECWQLWLRTYAILTLPFNHTTLVCMNRQRKKYKNPHPVGTVRNFTKESSLHSLRRVPCLCQGESLFLLEVSLHTHGTSDRLILNGLRKIRSNLETTIFIFIFLSVRTALVVFLGLPKKLLRRRAEVVRFLDYVFYFLSSLQ